MNEMYLKVSIQHQTMQVFRDAQLVKEYLISTAKNGAGEENGSEKTPRGWHVIRAKIGADAKPNTVFIHRRATGEIYSPELKAEFPQRDWILTRILWLSGAEVGKNRLGPNDTMRRFVYIHGTPDEVQMGKPGSRGCIRMRNSELIELFEITKPGTKILIEE